ncbi:MAG: DUF362 domain-containing protein [Candidatus Latescibacteria bacterium]|nr:DUF362 domain-containing protein [Candidatus Latescibacterota bacterium]
MARPEVFILKREIENSVREEDFETSAREIMRAMQVDSGGRTVFMKPNVTAGCHRNSGIVTHPTFTGGLVDYFADDTGLPRDQIFVGETTSITTTPEQRELHWARSGYTEMAREKRIRLIDPADYGNVRITPGRTHQIHNIGISRWAVADEVFYVNLPKLKTHNLGVVTLCGKNQQGIMIPVHERHLCSDAWNATFGSESKRGRDWMRVEDHEAWQRTIAHMHWDVYLACQPDFNVVEGVMGRDGNAFYLGRNFPCGLVVAGYDMPSVDLVASQLMGFTPDNLVYLQVGIDRGLCPPNLADVDVYNVSDGETHRVEDLAPFTADPKFEVYRDIPADYDKKDMFEEYDPESDTLMASA